MDFKKALTFAVGLIVAVIALGIPLTFLVWLCLRAMGFDFMIRQVVGAEVLYTIFLYWTWSFIEALKK